ELETAPAVRAAGPEHHGDDSSHPGEGGRYRHLPRARADGTRRLVQNPRRLVQIPLPCPSSSPCPTWSYAASASRAALRAASASSGGDPIRPSPPSLSASRRREAGSGVRRVIRSPPSG